MIEFGKKLQKKRIEKNLTLEQIAKETRINIKYLKAIEDEDFDNLPVAYMKLFMKTYSNVVDLKYPGDNKVFDLQVSSFMDDEVLKETDENSGEEKNSSIKNEISDFADEDDLEDSVFFSEKARDFVTKYYKLILFLLFTIIVLIVYFVYSSIQPEKTPKIESENVKIITVNDEENNIKVNVRDTINIITPVNTQQEEEKLVVPDSITFTLTAKDTSFLLYFIDNQDVIEKMLYPGDVLPIRAHKNIEIKTGRFEALNFKLNNEDKTELLFNQTTKRKAVFIKINDVFGTKIIKKSEKISQYLKEKYNYE